MSGLSGTRIFWAFTSFLGAIATCVGFFMPYWIKGRMLLVNYGNPYRTVPVHFGVFRRCNYPTTNPDGLLTMVLECGRYTTFSDIPSLSWKIATLTLGTGCCLCMLVALTAMFGVCVRGVIIPTVARTAGIIQLCSGLLMGAGIGVYPNGWESTEIQQSCGYTSKSYHLGECSLSWCFYLTSVGVGFTLLCSGLAFHAPKQKQIITGYPL